MFERDFEKEQLGYKVYEELSLRDRLRDMLAAAIAAFLKHFMKDLSPTFASSSKLLAEIFLVVEELGGA